MIPKMSSTNVGPSIIVVLLISYIMGDVIVPNTIDDDKLGVKVYFIFSVILSVVYTLWFFGKIGKE